MRLAYLYAGQTGKFAEPMQLLREQHITGPADSSNPSLHRTQEWYVRYYPALQGTNVNERLLSCDESLSFFVLVHRFGRGRVPRTYIWLS